MLSTTYIIVQKQVLHITIICTIIAFFYMTNCSQSTERRRKQQLLWDTLCVCFCVPQNSFICYATSPLSDSCCHEEPFKTYIKRVSSNWVLGVRLVLINRCLIKWALCVVDSMSDAIFHKWMQSSWKLLALSHRLRVWQRYKRKCVKVISYVYFECQNQV